MPFVKVPVQVAKYGLARSPVGLLNYKLWLNIARKDPQAADQLARLTLGSSIGGSLALYAYQGNITAAPPVGQADRDAFYRQGKQPYAVKIGNKWISYQQIPVVSTTLSMVASAVDAIKNGDKSASEKVSQVVYDIGRNTVDQTYLTGLSDTLDALTDPEKYGQQFVQHTVPSLMPASATTRLIAQATDTTIRKPENVGEGIMTNLPGLSRMVEPRLNALGEESKRETPFWSPYNVGIEKNSPLEKELSKQSIDVGFTGKEFSGFKLTDAEQGEYQQQAGQLTRKNLESIIQTKEYKSASGMKKQDLLKKAVKDSREMVHWQMLFTTLSQPHPGDDAATTAMRQDYKMIAEYEIVTRKQPADKFEKARATLRLKIPELDVALNIREGIETVKTVKAYTLLKQRARELGIPEDQLPALGKKVAGTTTTSSKAKNTLPELPAIPRLQALPAR
jgi:hypothetical protein